MKATRNAWATSLVRIVALGTTLGVTMMVMVIVSAVAIMSVAWVPFLFHGLAL